MVSSLPVFPSEAFPDFRVIRRQGLSFIDKTEFIPLMSETNPSVKLICRPERFGKSLTVSMLEYFHGFQYQDIYDELFEGLSVGDAVKRGEVNYGRYIVLRFDFSLVDQHLSNQSSERMLFQYINSTLSKFVRRLQEYPDLKLDMKALRQPVFEDPKLAMDNLVNVVNGIHDALSSAHDSPSSATPNIFSNVQGVCHFCILGESS